MYKVEYALGAIDSGPKTINLGIVFTLSSTADTRLTVVYRVSGSARSGVDYDPLPGTIAFAPGETSPFVQIKAREHRLTPKAHRVVRLRLHSGDGYTVGTNVPIKDLLTRYRSEF